MAPNDFPSSITAEILPLATNIFPAALFALMADEPWAIWLDSCDSNHSDSRFDIMVWQPDASLTTFGQDTHITRNTNTAIEISQHDPLSLVAYVQDEVVGKAKTPHPFLPFLGGALGYFAYDLGRRFEMLPVKAQQDIHLPDMAIGIYSQAIIYDNNTAKYYLICPQNKRNDIETWLQQKLIQQTEIKSTDKANFSLTTPWQANMDKASYFDKFSQVQEYLLSGDCYQINLAQRFSAQYQGDEFQAYLELREANQAPFSAFIRLNDAAILSISPERFLQCRQGKVQSKPIKGTLARSDNAQQDEENARILAASTKDRAENLMIVDLLRNDISKSCIAGSVKVPKLFDIESFPAVHHLVSTVEGRLSTDKKAIDLIRGAFPGGSITGAPKIRAMEIIEELEPHRRSVYCGSIGYISSCGTMDTSITIRTLICQTSPSSSEKNIHCWAGGGLVADSTPASEYQETFDKVNCILPILSKLSPSTIEPSNTMKNETNSPKTNHPKTKHLQTKHHKE